MGINDTFSIATQALLIAQNAMGIISNNMANVNTEGYSRQVLELASSPTYKSKYGEIGTGVDAVKVRRITDQYATRALIDKSSTLAKYETEGEIISQMETIFNETYGQGLNAVLSEYWSAWDDLANNPEGNAERLVILEKGEAVVSSITQLRTDMDLLMSDINSRIENAVDEINQITGEIAELNASINRIEIGALEATDARDKRDVLLRQLAELTEISQFEDAESGMVYVMTPKGYPLVDGPTAWEMETQRDYAGNVQTLWIHENGAAEDISGIMTEGRLGGLINMQQNVLPDFYDQLDDFASTLISEVNRQFAQGVGLNPITEVTGTEAVQPYARLETALTGDHNDLVFTANATGSAGDGISVTYVSSGDPLQALGISVSGDEITVSLETDAFGQVTTTAVELLQFISMDQSAGAAAARDLVSVDLAGGSSGNGLLTTMGSSELNRQLSNILNFGDKMTAGSFDLVAYDATGSADITTITVNPTDTREDIIAQIGQSFSAGIQGIKASMVADTAGQQYLKIEADTGYSFAFANDTASALMALGINTFFSGGDSSDIAVNAIIADDISLISAGQLDANGEMVSGSNTNALSIAGLKDQTFSFSKGPATISEAYNTLSADVGSTAYSIYRNAEFNETLVNQLEAQRDNAAGVSIDEELANMIKFQYSYMAASKLISTTEELLKTLVNVI